MKKIPRIKREYVPTIDNFWKKPEIIIEVNKILNRWKQQ